LEKHEERERNMRTGIWGKWGRWMGRLPSLSRHWRIHSSTE